MLVCDKRDRATTLSSLNIHVFRSFTKNFCLKESEVWQKVTSNKIIVMLATHALPSSILSRPVALVHYYVTKEVINSNNNSLLIPLSHPKG